jgi:hypothetical protein
MRIDIKTNGKPVRDNDIKALYILDYAMNLSSDEMLSANIKFVLSKHKKRLTKSNY